MTSVTPGARLRADDWLSSRERGAPSSREAWRGGATAAAGLRGTARLALVFAMMALTLTGCGSSDYRWAWRVIDPTTKQGYTNVAFLLSGLGATIAVTLIAFALSTILGLALAILGLSRAKALRALYILYTDVMRSIPLLVMLIWVYYALPLVLGVNLDYFTATVVALVASDSAFQAEIYRAGVQSIDKGQGEAADSLGLSWKDKMRDVILPQAIRRILPPLGNQFVYVLKMSSLASVIGLAELTRKANELVTIQYRALEIYSFLVLEYCVLVMIVSFAVRRMERRLRADRSAAR